MKRILTITLLFIISALLLSCGTRKYVDFDFHPSVPYKSIIEMMKTKIFINEIVKENMDIGLIAGFNETGEKFIILSAIIKGYFPKKPIEKFSLNVSSLIKLDKLEKLIQIVEASIECWDKEQDKSENIFYKFYIYPEHQEIRLSHNVIKFRGSFIFEYQNSINGSVSHIFLGDKIPFHRLIEDKEIIIEFKNLLMEGKDYLDSLEQNLPDTNFKS